MYRRYAKEEIKIFETYDEAIDEVNTLVTKHPIEGDHRFSTLRKFQVNEKYYGLGIIRYKIFYSITYRVNKYAIHTAQSLNAGL